jgi:predicted ATP-grasp superfamily ATP-dependent carboligase
MQAGRAEKHILQPFVLGLAVSVAFIISAKECVALLPAEQHLSEDGRFRYLGGAIPLAPDIAQRAEHLARRALETIPGLLGFVGVDLVLGEKGDGSEDWVIEINPRLTTSYIGQRLMTPSNLAQSMLQAASGSSIEPLEWLDNRVTFRSDGSFQMTA